MPDLSVRRVKASGIPASAGLVWRKAVCAGFFGPAGRVPYEGETPSRAGENLERIGSRCRVSGTRPIGAERATLFADTRMRESNLVPCRYGANKEEPPVLSAADNKLLTLVGNLNNAITDPECWPDVLQQLQDVFGGSACAIASHHCDTGNGRLVRSVNINAEFERSYA